MVDEKLDQNELPVNQLMVDDMVKVFKTYMDAYQGLEQCEKECLEFFKEMEKLTKMIPHQNDNKILFETIKEYYQNLLQTNDDREDYKYDYIDILKNLRIVKNQF